MRGSRASQRRIGSSIAEVILKATEAKPIVYASSSLTAISKVVELPVQNPVFVDLARKGVVKRTDLRDGGIPSTINYFKVSPFLEGMSLLGEPLPSLGFKVKSMLKAPFAMLVELGDDEPGHIIHIDDWREGGTRRA